MIYNKSGLRSFTDDTAETFADRIYNDSMRGLQQNADMGFPFRDFNANHDFNGHLNVPDHNAHDAALNDAHNAMNEFHTYEEQGGSSITVSDDGSIIQERDANGDLGVVVTDDGIRDYAEERMIMDTAAEASRIDSDSQNQDIVEQPQDMQMADDGSVLEQWNNQETVETTIEASVDDTWETMVDSSVETFEDNSSEMFNEPSMQDAGEMMAADQNAGLNDFQTYQEQGGSSITASTDGSIIQERDSNGDLGVVITDDGVRDYAEERMIMDTAAEASRIDSDSQNQDFGNDAVSEFGHIVDDGSAMEAANNSDASSFYEAPSMDSVGESNFGESFASEGGFGGEGGWGGSDAGFGGDGGWAGGDGGFGGGGWGGDGGGFGGGFGGGGGGSTYDCDNMLC